MPKTRQLFNRSSEQIARIAKIRQRLKVRALKIMNISEIPAEQPVLIAGPTASGKSALALEIAQAKGGIIINADASQVFEGWRVLTARPSVDEETRAPHYLYGHVDFTAHYSAGQWLRDLAPLLSDTGQRPIIVGGTGLYFLALTEGLADIPETPADVRAEANRLREAGKLEEMIESLDAETQAKIDLHNPMRVQRAWEVQRATGHGLANWHARTPAPLLPLNACEPIVLEAETEWLNDRIARRFDMMVAEGALEEARANLDRFDPDLLSCKAIGAPELTAHLRGELTLDQAKEAASIATRQFAKRQRTWFRARMKSWNKHVLP